MLEDDAFLKDPRSDEPFTNPLLHDFFSQLKMLNAEISAPKAAFVIMKVIEGLKHPDGFHRSVSAEEESLASDTYHECLRLVLQYAGKNHWATHRFSGTAAAPQQTYILIRKDKEVRVYCADCCVFVYVRVLSRQRSQSQVIFYSVRVHASLRVRTVACAHLYACAAGNGCRDATARDRVCDTQFAATPKHST